MNPTNPINTRNTRNLIILCFLLFALSICIPSLLEAKVTGVCSNCHTMHNSQNGQPMARQLKTDYSGFEADTTPNEMLLISDCIGCHTSTGSTTIVNNTPIVFNTSTYSNPLAGGNFNDVRTDDTKGHNVQGIAGADGTLDTLTKIGYSGTYDPADPDFDMSQQLRCAGRWGCHGNRDQADPVVAVKGAHHTSDTTIDGSTVGNSYRFLGKTGTNTGTLGVEDNDWEAETSIDHNNYKGATADSTSTTISYLCRNCHGKFHVEIYGTTRQSPWLRHPTDYLLPTTGEYSSYNPPTTYDNTAPVAYTDPANPSRSTAVVMCLSCHRAHASPYFKIMRWDYKRWPECITVAPLCTINGCNVCHTSKN